MSKKNKIFDDSLFKMIKTKSGTDARVMSWNGLALFLALRMSELESELRGEIAEIRKELNEVKTEKKTKSV